MSRAFFSVVIPSYNSSAFIEKALVSVCGQTYPHFEIIVSDDGSSDDTIAVVKTILQRYDVNYQIIENVHQGLPSTRNSAIKKANYEWIALLDSDDYWTTNKLEEVNKVIEHDQAVSFVFHNEIYFNDSHEWPVNYVERYHPDVHPFLALVRNNFLSPSSAIIRKDLLEKIGLFDVSLLSIEDYDSWLKMSLLPEFKLGAINQYLAYTWVRPGNMSSNVPKMLEYLLKVYERFQPEILRISPRPILELMRFKGRIYSGSGLTLWRQQQFILGLWYMMLGHCYWVRIDWIHKAIKRSRSLL